MCLVVNTKEDLTKRKVQSNGLIKVWKILRKTTYGPISPFLRWSWIPGWNESDRNSKELSKSEKLNSIVSYGIHVFLDRKSARIYKRRDARKACNTIVPVYVSKKDLVASGEYVYKDGEKTKEAAFMKVFLKKEDYKKAVVKK